MPEQPKLCPLSFGFNIKQQSQNIIDPKRVDVRIQVGFPCLKEKCNWHSELINDCVIWEILRQLNQLVGKEENVK